MSIKDPIFTPEFTNFCLIQNKMFKIIGVFTLDNIRTYTIQYSYIKDYNKDINLKLTLNIKEINTKTSEIIEFIKN